MSKTGPVNIYLWPEVKARWRVGKFSRSLHVRKSVPQEIPEPVCNELQLFKVSVYPLSVEFFFTHITSSKCNPLLLLAIVQAFLQNAK
jgi:hypothetical protein